MACLFFKVELATSRHAKARLRVAIERNYTAHLCAHGSPCRSTRAHVSPLPCAAVHKFFLILLSGAVIIPSGTTMVRADPMSAIPDLWQPNPICILISTLSVLLEFLFRQLCSIWKF